MMQGSSASKFIAGYSSTINTVNDYTLSSSRSVAVKVMVYQKLIKILTKPI